MPDIGEGIAEVELVAWHVQPGDAVAEDQVLADVMTDKATVEIPSPVVGKVLALGGEVGQMLAVGAELIRIEVEARRGSARQGGSGAGAGACARSGCADCTGGRAGRDRPPPAVAPPRPRDATAGRRNDACTPTTGRSRRPRCAAAPGSSASS